MSFTHQQHSFLTRSCFMSITQFSFKNEGTANYDTISKNYQELLVIFVCRANFQKSNPSNTHTTFIVYKYLHRALSSLKSFRNCEFSHFHGLALETTKLWSVQGARLSQRLLCKWCRLSTSHMWPCGHGMTNNSSIDRQCAAGIMFSQSCELVKN